MNTMTSYSYDDLIKKLIGTCAKNGLKIITRDPAAIDYVVPGNDTLQFDLSSGDRQIHAEDWYEISGNFGGCRRAYSKGYFVEVVSDLKLLNRRDHCNAEHNLYLDDYVIQASEIRLPHERIYRPTYSERVKNQ